MEDLIYNFWRGILQRRDEKDSHVVATAAGPDEGDAAGYPGAMISGRGVGQTRPLPPPHFLFKPPMTSTDAHIKDGPDGIYCHSFFMSRYTCLLAEDRL